MSARRIVARIGLAAIAAAHLWCSSSDDEPPAAPPAADGGADAGAGDAAPSIADAALPEVPACNETFCRVSLPDAATVALDGVLARSASDVWVVGSAGYAARFDGSTWRRIETGTKATIFGVTASGDGTVWGASSGASFLVLSRAADGGVEVVDGGFKGIVRAVAAAGAQEVWAVGNAFPDFFSDPPAPIDFVWRYVPDGGGWRPISPPCPNDELGQPACMKLNALWAESGARVWLAGDEGKIFRADTSSLGGTGADGGEPSRLELQEMSSSSLRRLESLWGFGPNDVWAVGAQGVIRHWVGGEAWSVVASPVTADLHGVWGSRPDDVWAVGDEGAVVHWDGKAWSVVTVPLPEENRPRLYAVAGAGNDVWIAGEGTLLRTNQGTGGDR